jgi:biopolymer transport protein ExbD
MQFVRKRRRQPFINIISLIDILVVLLIFYIATTVFKRAQPKLNIVVPKSQHAAATDENIPSTIYVTADSKVFLDAAPVDPDQLGQLLKDKKAANPNFNVAMKADQAAPFKIIVKIMDAAKDAQIANLNTYMDVKANGASNP